MAYVPAGNFDISADVFILQEKTKTITFSGMPAPAVGDTSTAIITATSYFAKDIYVTYDIQFAPSYYLP